MPLGSEKASSRRLVWVWTFLFVCSVQLNHGLLPKFMKLSSADTRIHWNRDADLHSSVVNGTSCSPTINSSWFETSSLPSNHLIDVDRPNVVPPLHRRRLRREVQNAHVKALAQVASIMELCSEGKYDGVAGSVVSHSLESVIRKIYVEGNADKRVLDQLESLLWRCTDYDVVPSFLSLQTFWLLHQRLSFADRSDGALEDHVERSVRLLQGWSNLSLTNDLLPPPKQYFIDTFVFVRQQSAEMTPGLWSLYEIHRRCNSPRQLFEAVLDVLDSSEEWKIHQCTILKDMTRLGNARLDSDLVPTVEKLESALEVASRIGDAQQAGWLYQMLATRKTHPLMKNEMHFRSWFLSLCNSKAKGSGRYLERLLQHARQNDWTSPINSKDYYKMVLRKFSASRKPGSGMRAEKLYQGLLKAYDETGDVRCLPDLETQQLVAQAYLNEIPSNPQNVIDAKRVLQQKKEKSPIF